MEPKRVQVVDVREAYRREIDAVPGALPVSLYDILAGARLPPREDALVVVAEDRRRAEFARTVLEERGFRVAAVDLAFTPADERARR